MGKTRTAIKHSDQFDTFVARYERNFITKQTLQGWVVINSKVPTKGITKEEYFEITDEVYPE